MDTTELIIFLEQLMRTAERIGMANLAEAMSDNIRVLAQNLECEAVRRRPLRRQWRPWWAGLDEVTFKTFVRTFLKEPGSDSERLKRSLESISILKNLSYPVNQIKWVDDISAELKK